MYALWAIFCVCSLPLILGGNVNPNVKYLDAGDVVNYSPASTGLGFYQAQLSIYCYRGLSKSIPRMFYTIGVHLEIENDDFTQYEGSTPEIVKENYDGQKSIFNLNLFSHKRTRLKLNPFNQTCIGIESISPYSVRLYLIRLDFYKLFLLCLGFFTFWFSSKLSNNSVFYYITGIIFGIFASFIILVYLVSKLFPRRPLMYGVLVGGSTLAVYLFQLIWENMQMIIMTYQTFLGWYTLVTGILSFVVCYRIGPPKNQRSKDLTKWGLQIVSLAMIYLSTHFEEASFGIIIMMVLAYYFPRRGLNKLRRFYIRRFPPKPRLLSNEEYYEEGAIETSKALENLRKYCSSPECKQWKIVTKLKDPIKFASFIEGSSHVLDEEILEYETSRQDASETELSEDEDENINFQYGKEQEDDISEDEDANIQEPPGQSNLRVKKTSTPHNGAIYSSNRGASSINRTSNRKVIYKSYEREYSDED